ncbi:Protein prenyltransferase, alpha subunit [Dillenia turbinata]|uniref:Protein prenyltransferase, alpha subunit n=1 Tax=Dillenia turbinata TaxID=194707 RepID=A0AAN8UP24_9MAGN
MISTHIIQGPVSVMKELGSLQQRRSNKSLQYLANRIMKLIVVSRKVQFKMMSPIMMNSNNNLTYNVLLSFLTQTKEYLHKLGSKITATKNQQEVEEADYFRILLEFKILRSNFKISCGERVKWKECCVNVACKIFIYDLNMPGGKWDFAFSLINLGFYLDRSLIDEVGFIHPSQFVALDQHGEDELLQSEGGIVSSCRLRANFPETGKVGFWCRDHKLGISTEVLFPLYNTAKHSFMDAVRQNKILRNVKMVLTKDQDLSRYMDELHFSALILSYSPKSEQAWSQRRWVIRMIAERCPNLQEVVEKESDLVGKIAEKYKMNYRAWNHRGWLVSYMSISQVLNELNKSRHWASLHVADNSCFHYRRRLLVKIFSSKEGPSPVLNCSAILNQVWKEELDWNEMLIRHYMGREVSQILFGYHPAPQLPVTGSLVSSPVPLFVLDKAYRNRGNGVSSQLEDNTTQNIDLAAFVDNEFQLLENYPSVPDNDFEDSKAQAELSASHFSWLGKQCAKSLPMEIQEKLRTRDIKTLLNKVCPEKSFLWNDLSFGESIQK